MFLIGVITPDVTLFGNVLRDQFGGSQTKDSLVREKEFITITRQAILNTKCHLENASLESISGKLSRRLMILWKLFLEVSSKEISVHSSNQTSKELRI